MKPTASHRATPKAPPLSASFSASVTDELHRYDEHLRDVRGLAAGTRKDRLVIAGLLLPGGWILIEQLPTHRAWRRHCGVTFAIGPRAVIR